MTVSEDMVKRALDAYENALRNLPCNISAEPISVSEIRERCIRAALTAALSEQVVMPKESTGIVRSVGWIRNDDADPNDEDAVRFFGVAVEYPNEPPTFSPSIVWAKTPVCIVPAPPPVSPAGDGK